MAKFKELQLGQQVRLVSSEHTDSEHGYISKPMLEVGAVGTITDLCTFDKGVRLDGQIYVYHRKDLEIVSEDVSEPVRTEPVTTAKDVPVGTKVRIRDFRNNTYERSNMDRVYPQEMDATIGEVGVVTRFRAIAGVHVEFNDGSSWSYCYDFVEPVAEQSVLTTEPSTSKVDASTPIGTKVRVLRDQEYGYYKAGAVGTLGRHDGDDKPRIDFIDDFWYPHYNNLEIVPQDTPDTVCKPEPEPVAAPKELTLEDFVVTRVRVKDTGAKGTVIGTVSGIIVVQHDEDKPHSYHNGSRGEIARGRDNACYWYTPSQLEIITEEV